MTFYFRLSLLSLFLIIWNTNNSAALPPQLDAANDFIYDSELRRLPQSFDGAIDQNGVVHLAYTALEANEDKPLRYISFSQDGNIASASRIALPCGFFSCYSYITIFPDLNNNIHILAKDFNKGDVFDYFMCNVMQNIENSFELKPLEYLTISNIHSYSNKGIIVNGLGKSNAYGPLMDIFLISDNKYSEFRPITIPSPQTADKNKNWFADFYALDDSLILLVTRTFKDDIRQMFIRKTIVNIERQQVVDFQYFNPHDSISCLYSGLRLDIKLPSSSFILIGDTIIYLCRLPLISEDKMSMEGDSLGLLYFDKSGSVVKKKSIEHKAIKYENLAEAQPGDMLCRSNAYYQYWHDIESAYSPFGLLSFREFPKLIIDARGQ